MPRKVKSRSRSPPKRPRSPPKRPRSPPKRPRSPPKRQKTPGKPLRRRKGKGNQHVQKTIKATKNSIHCLKKTKSKFPLVNKNLAKYVKEVNDEPKTCQIMTPQGDIIDLPNKYPGDDYVFENLYSNPEENMELVESELLREVYNKYYRMCF